MKRFLLLTYILAVGFAGCATTPMQQISFDRDLRPFLADQFPEKLRMIQGSFELSDVGSITDGGGNNNSGKWRSFSFHAKPKTAKGEYTQVLKFTIYDGKPVADSLSIEVVMPNQALVPTVASVTPAADAPVAPAAPAAHL